MVTVVHAGLVRIRRPQHRLRPSLAEQHPRHPKREELGQVEAVESAADHECIPHDYAAASWALPSKLAGPQMPRFELRMKSISSRTAGIEPISASMRIKAAEIVTRSM